MNPLYFRSLIIIIALLLTVSFVSHDVIHHNHPEEIFGNEIQAVLHMEDRKWRALFILVLLSLGTFLQISSVFKVSVTPYNVYYYVHVVALTIVSPLHEALRRRILRPKLCE